VGGNAAGFSSLSLVVVPSRAKPLLAFRKQSTEVRVIEQQLNDQREERRRAQANLISMWTEWNGNPPNRIGTVHIENNSPQPIPRLFIRWDNEPTSRRREMFFAYLGMLVRR